MTWMDKALLTIAKRTLQMSPAMAGVMGGMSREVAKAILEAHDADRNVRPMQHRFQHLAKLLDE